MDQQTAHDHFEREEHERVERNAALAATPLETPTTVRTRLARFWEVASTIHAGLLGESYFSWRAVDMQHSRKALKAMGITLITKSRAEKLGFVLKKNAKPVGSVYFNAPISKHADVYVLECQFAREKE